MNSNETSTIDFKEGASYRLTQDVKNPKKDKRRTRDWNAVEVFKAGTVFQARLEDHGTGETYWSLRKRGSYWHMGFNANGPQGKALLPFLEEVNDLKAQIWQLVFDTDIWSDDHVGILVKLVKADPTLLEPLKAAALKLREVRAQKVAAWEARELTKKTTPAAT